MKLAWVQILLSLVIGFSTGIVFDKFSTGKHCFGKCPCALSESKGCCMGPCALSGLEEHCKGEKWSKHGKHIKKEMLEHFSSELSLTEEQKTKVATIFDTKHKKMMELREEMRPKFEAIRKSIHNEISAILTPGQKEKFEKVDAEWKSKHKKWDSDHENTKS